MNQKFYQIKTCLQYPPYMVSTKITIYMYYHWGSNLVTWVFNSFHNFYIHDAQYLCIKISQRCFHLWNLCPLENLYIYSKYNCLCNRILEIYRRQIKIKILLLEMFVAHRLPTLIGLFCWAEFYSRETLFISA